jgi:hypothetical protein
MSPTMKTLHPLFPMLASALMLLFSSSAYCAALYVQAPLPLAKSSTVNSNAVSHPDGSDGNVTAFDNFTLKKSGIISSVTWRGASADNNLAGFVIKIYESKQDAAAQPDLAAPLAEIRISGNADEKPVGNNLSDFRANFSQPLALTAGVQYWITIVCTRNGPSPWGWANGSGGDGKTIQSYAEFKILPAPGDRAFSLNDRHGMQ